MEPPSPTFVRIEATDKVKLASVYYCRVTSAPKKEVKFGDCRKSEHLNASLLKVVFCRQGKMTKARTKNGIGCLEFSVCLLAF